MFDSPNAVFRTEETTQEKFLARSDVHALIGVGVDLDEAIFGIAFIVMARDECENGDSFGIGLQRSLKAFA